MARLMRYFLVLSLSTSAGHYAVAQDEEVTPRQAFTSFVSGIAVEDLLYKPFELTEIEPVTAQPALSAENVPVDTPEKPKAADITPLEISPERIADIPDTPDVPQAVVELEKSIAEDEPPAPQPSIEPKTTVKEAALGPLPPEEDIAPLQTVPSAYSANLLPFYVSASEYLQARNTAKHPQMTLTYNVTVANAKSGLKVDPKIITLKLGPDYAAITKKDVTRIFDFKTNRLLTLSQNGGSPFFNNVSIYPGVLRNVDTVKKSTRKGQKQFIKVGPDTELDAFWLEAGIGWSARPVIEGLTVTRDGAAVTAQYKDKTPLKLALNGPDIPSDNHMRVLYAYWLHDLPIHPAILPDIGRPEKAPTSLSFLSYSPKYPDGLQTHWTLASSNIDEGTFPLPKDLPNAMDAGQTTPLAFVIAESARKDRGQISEETNALRQMFVTALKNTNDMEAWMAGQTLAARQGGCANDEKDLCETLLALERAAPATSDLSQLSFISKQGETPKTREAALKNLLPFIEDDISPAFLLKKAGKLRARLKTAQITDQTVKAAKASNLLEKALLNDPLDPETYRSLSQVYAADGRFAESWDLLDALRRLEATPEKLTAPVNRVEKSLKRQAPGYFVATEP